jgi:hypothetical protein
MPCFQDISREMLNYLEEDLDFRVIVKKAPMQSENTHS